MPIMFLFACCCMGTNAVCGIWSRIGVLAAAVHVMNLCSLYVYSFQNVKIALPIGAEELRYAEAISRNSYKFFKMYVCFSPEPFMPH